MRCHSLACRAAAHKNREEIKRRVHLGLLKSEGTRQPPMYVHLIYGLGITEPQPMQRQNYPHWSGCGVQELYTSNRCPRGSLLLDLVHTRSTTSSVALAVRNYSICAIPTP